MKHAPYMASTELNQLMWLSAFVQAMEKILKDETTTDKQWRRWLKTASSYVMKVADARICDLDQKEKVKVARRIEQIGIKVYSHDDYRVDKDDQGRKYTISMEDFLDLVDAATLHCYSCPQGDVVAECPRRKMFHRLGLSCHALRTDPAPGECEWRYENSQRTITPQYKCLGKEQISQLP